MALPSRIRRLLAHSLAWRIGLLGQALIPLAIGTAMVVALGTLVSYQLSATTQREAALQDVLSSAVDRSAREQAMLDRVEHQVRNCRSILEQRLSQAERHGTAIPLSRDGTRRALPLPGQAPVAAFVTAGTANDLVQVRVAGIAYDLLAEIGPVVADYPPNLTIAMPGSWLVGWGADPVELAGTMLPDDPVLLPAEREMISDRGLVRWSRTFLEPASENWLVAASASLSVPGGKRASVTQVLPIDQLLGRTMESRFPGSETMVYDDAGRLLAHSRYGDLIRTSGGTMTLESSQVPLLMRIRTLIPRQGPAAERIGDSDGWFGVSRLPAPGWTIVTFYPEVAIATRARATAFWIIVIGVLIIGAQALLLLVVLRLRIERPLRRLTEAAGALAAGKHGPALDTKRTDEFGELSMAFAAMSAAVASREGDLRSALAALREREELARALVSSAADAVVVIEGELVVDANPRAGEIFACPANELIGRRLAELAPAEQPAGITSERTWSRHLDTVKGGQTQHFAWRGRRMDGREFEAEFGLARVMLPGRYRLLAVIRDVTERNQLELQLRQRQKMDSLGQLAGGIAHDYNNMLTGIMGSADLLLQRHRGDPSERHLRLILRASERAADLTRKLLTFARVGRGMRTPVDVHQVVRDTAAMLEHSIDKRILIRTSLEAVHSTIAGDASQLQSALLNLGVNARDAMPEGGELLFATAERTLDGSTISTLSIPVEPGRYLELRVSDTGTGMAEEVISHIFEPFFTTKPIGKGTGLGLAAVFGTMRDHHGSVKVESRLGTGTTFRLYLRLTEAAAPGTSEERTTAVQSRRGTVLVIDDEEIARDTMCAMLVQLGYEVLSARDGIEGVEAFASGSARIEVVFIDMEMPHMRGIDCLRKLQQISPEVCAVLCSGFARDSTPELLHGEGFRAQLTKPYLLDDLARTLDALTPPRKA
jgi:PAS domain S-box-containing protein